MVEKYLTLNLDDENSSVIAEVLANKTCKKILVLLSEKDFSETDISKQLKLPLNTIEYNLNKLIKAQLIEKSNQFFWSVKGKKIPTYRLANKKIIISTKSKVKGIIPTILASGLFALLIKYYNSSKEIINNPTMLTETTEKAADLAYAAASGSVESNSCSIQQSLTNSLSNVGILQSTWIWFLIGALFGLIAFLIFNNLKGGFKK